MLCFSLPMGLRRRPRVCNAWCLLCRDKAILMVIIFLIQAGAGPATGPHVLVCGWPPGAASWLSQSHVTRHTLGCFVWLFVVICS